MNSIYIWCHQPTADEVFGDEEECIHQIMYLSLKRREKSQEIIQNWTYLHSQSCTAEGVSLVLNNAIWSTQRTGSPSETDE